MRAYVLACSAVTGAGHVQESEREGETEEQIKDELVGFLVQKAYCKQRLGQNDLAEKEYEEELKLKPSDQEVAAVASNNLFALRGKDTSLFDSAKKARALNLDTAVEEKLTLQQRRVFAINRCLLSLYTNKHKECLATLAKLEKELTGSELPSLVKAALTALSSLMLGSADNSARGVAAGGVEGVLKALETFSDDARPHGVVYYAVSALYEVSQGGPAALARLRALGAAAHVRAAMAVPGVAEKAQEYGQAILARLGC